MRSAEANQELEKLARLSVEDFDAELIVEKLKEIREIAKEEKDPAVIKILRLCYEYIEENEDFDLDYFEKTRNLQLEGEEDDEEDDDTEIDDMGMTDFEYLMQLIIRSSNESNRIEIGHFRDILYEELY